jgi:hypothetical protein
MENIGWLWLLLAVLNARWARRKNRSGLDWFVISLFIGPLATVLVWVWSRSPETGPAKWTSALASGGFAALAGAVFCAAAALAVNGSGPLWVPCAFYVVGAAVFTWLYLRERAAT